MLLINICLTVFISACIPQAPAFLQYRSYAGPLMCQAPQSTVPWGVCKKIIISPWARDGVRLSLMISLRRSVRGNTGFTAMPQKMRFWICAAHIPKHRRKRYGRAAVWFSLWGSLIWTGSGTSMIHMAMRRMMHSIRLNGMAATEVYWFRNNNLRWLIQRRKARWKSI